jgi:hypothetical protein
VQATGDFNNYNLRIKQMNQYLAVVSILVGLLALGVFSLYFFIGEKDPH